MVDEMGTFRTNVELENPVRPGGRRALGGDLVLLGARSLEGPNLHADPISKRLIDAGPVPAAAAA